jgi:transcriptional regulator with XRE-family HTH domain
MKDLPADRRRLASVLRSLRTEAGLSTTELAKRLDWSQSKVSRTELGRTLAKPHEVEAWTRVTEADAELQGELLRIATRAADEFAEWRRELAPGRRRVQEEIQQLEEVASVIRVFAPRVVVGLAQTGPYAEAMFRIGRRVGPAEDLGEVVRARLEREVVLDDDAKHFYLLMGETSLRRRLISLAAMRDQVERLIELSAQDNITMGVIPFDAEERVHQYHGFAIIGDLECDQQAIVLAETVTRGINIREPEEIAEYVAHFEALRSAALEGERLREFLRGVIAGLE